MFGSGVDGAVAYLERDRAALVWSDPLAAPEDAGALLAEATAELRGRGLRTCLILVGEETAAHALACGYAVLKIGEQPFFSLADWQQPRGDRGKHLRWCLNRAARAGIEIRPYEPRDARDAADALLAWECGLGRPAAQSFLRASPLALAEGEAALGRRAPRPDRGDPRVHARGRRPLVPRGPRPAAPPGTTEALVVETLRRLAADGAPLAWMDIAPLRGSARQLDGRAQLLFRVAQPAIALFDSRYRFRALATYLEKFVPTGWFPRFVALNPAWPTLRVLRTVGSLL